MGKLVALASAAFLAFAVSAQAQNLNLGPSSGLSSPVDLAHAGGGQINVDIFRSFSEPATFGTSLPGGTATFGPMNTNFGPVDASGVLPATTPPANESFQYSDQVNSLSGTVTWNDLTFNGELVGELAVSSSTGSSAFTSAFPMNKNAAIMLTFSGAFTPGQLLMSQSPGKSGTASIFGGQVIGASGGGTMCVPKTCP